MPYRSASGMFTLHDDASVREKLTVMSKWEAMMDDARNREGDDFGDRVEALLMPGRTYRVTVEEVDAAGAHNPGPSGNVWCFTHESPPYGSGPAADSRVAVTDGKEVAVVGRDQAAAWFMARGCHPHTAAWLAKGPMSNDNEACEPG